MSPEGEASDKRVRSRAEQERDAAERLREERSRNSGSPEEELDRLLDTDDRDRGLEQR